MVTRRERLRENTKTEIKQYAREQLREHGPMGISLRGIADKIGFTVAAIYRYYDSLDAVITALIVDSFNAHADAIEQAVLACHKQDYGGQLLAFMSAYRAWALANPMDFLLIYGTPIPGYDAPEEITTQAARRPGIVSTRILSGALAAGRLRVDLDHFGLPPALRATLIEKASIYPEGNPLALFISMYGWTWMHGFVMLEIANHITPTVGTDGAFYEWECRRIVREFGLLD